MELSIFIAKIIAVVYLSVGVGMLLNGKYFKKMMNDMMGSPGQIYLGGLMALIAGFLIVTYHNIWVKDWTVIITVLGWMALVKGVTLLAFPKATLEMFKGMMKKWNFSIMGVFVIILGLILGYFGFII